MRPSLRFEIKNTAADKPQIAASVTKKAWAVMSKIYRQKSIAGNTSAKANLMKTAASTISSYAALL